VKGKTMMNGYAFERTPQLRKLKLDLETSTATALQSSDIADVVLSLLARADELCQMADASGADMSKLAGAFEHKPESLNAPKPRKH
jgi:hypothetical protein